MANPNPPKATPDRVKHKVHRRCPHCKKTHVSAGATQVTTRLNGEYPAMLRLHCEITTKQDLIEVAQVEGVSLAALVRRILREFLASRPL